MTRHNERAFDNRTSPLAPTDKIYMPYAWITCQEVNQVILSHNLSVQVSVRVCSSAYTHLSKVLDKTQPVKAGKEPLGAFGTRGRWTRCITATSSSCAAKQVAGEQILEEMEVLEDEGFQHAILDQRGDTQNTYKVSV